jgi:hypothetical protein
MAEAKKDAVAAPEIQELSTAVGYSKKWTKLIGHVNGFSARFIVAIADHVARFPKYYLVGLPVLTVALVVIGILTNFIQLKQMKTYSLLRSAASPLSTMSGLRTSRALFKTHVLEPF